MSKLDDAMANMIDAMGKDNYWDTEAYAEQALDYLNDSDNVVAKEIDRDELISFVTSTRDTAKEFYKNQQEEKRLAKEKHDLIESIVNFNPKEEVSDE